MVAIFFRAIIKFSSSNKIGLKESKGGVKWNIVNILVREKMEKWMRIFGDYCLKLL
jgi:hypothetical protein